MPGDLRTDLEAARSALCGNDGRANPARVFIACPFSNEVVVGLREPEAQQFRYDKLAGDGITLNFSETKSVDPQRQTVTLADTSHLILIPAVGAE